MQNCSQMPNPNMPEKGKGLSKRTDSTDNNKSKVLSQPNGEET